MEVEKDSTISRKEEEEDGDALLPGFRFHPTDEELVGFYLRRRVEKRLISIELIKQVDIYKYDPWDLPKSRDTKEKEMYFFCKRGRKYKNSIRPNRVTCSGFWKATGIDKPVYNSAGSSGNQCIGLKKSLVYYRGSAGKGTKTDWMMHEFRLPATHDQRITHIKVKSDIDNNNNDQEAEVWTLCRILKRNATYRKSEGMIINQEVNISSNTYSMDSSSCENRQRSSYNISFGDSVASIRQNDENAQSSHGESIVNQQFMGHFSPSSLFCGDVNELLRHADWEDLRSVVDYAAATDTSSFYL